MASRDSEKRASGGRNGQSLTAAIAAAIADHKGVEPAKLRTPLYDVVDIEALEALFGPQSSGAPGFDGYVSFVIEGCTVRIDSDGDVSVTDA